MKERKRKKEKSREIGLRRQKEQEKKQRKSVMRVENEAVRVSAFVAEAEDA